MRKQKLTLLYAILLGFGIALSDSLDLDDAQEQLDELRSIVMGSIMASWSQYSIIYMDVLNHGDKIYRSGGVSIDQVHDQVSEELEQIKQLAQQANKDISRCTSGREQMIHQLPNELKDRLLTCKNNQVTESEKIIDESKYLVDITMMKVDNYQFQFTVCAGNSLCLDPIVNEIQKSMDSIPLDIDIEISRARDLLEEVKVIIVECSDTNVADFTGYVNELVEQIATCAGPIIGRS